MNAPLLEKSGWQSVRTILEALILAALMWCGNSLISTGKTMAVLSDRMESMSKQMQGVPELGTRVTKLELRVEQHQSDIQELRQLRAVK